MPTHLSMPMVSQNQGALPLPPSQVTEASEQSDATKKPTAEEAAAAQKTFDFHYVKILLRQSSSQKKG